MNSCSDVPLVCAGWKLEVGSYVGLVSSNGTLLAPVPPVTAGGEDGDCGDVVLVLLSAGLALLFSHTMRMMMTVTTSSTASNDTTTPATIPADDPLVVLPPDPLSVVEKHFTSA